MMHFVWVALSIAAALVGRAGACPAGEGYVSPIDETCILCGEGTYSAEGAANCTQCPAGTWNDQVGSSSQSECMQCPTGTWSTVAGAGSASTCIACDAGKYQAAVGQANKTTCLACPSGTFGAVQGASACSACPSGTWSEDFGSSACKIRAEGKWTKRPLRGASIRKNPPGPINRNCGHLQDFQLDIGASAQFTDPPVSAASCTISADTSTFGPLCWFPEDPDLALCFDETCYRAGVSSPHSITLQKPAGPTVLTVKNLHVSHCHVNVLNFMYCCSSVDYM
eukprot:CAMPEP_0115218388 /NCGR_PEP_ID=MMETSP0270-20121206/26368_1 /TAXON_ID=71861 /ORGANISM="Scrippsiella trochoidea, Strain CCMP3099" /LENGTH=280 /DNA_ID=CAMNT_0002632335 /DNA_START=36 /DNA_END=878 /DNA_ORIENTATION=-